MARINVMDKFIYRKRKREREYNRIEAGRQAGGRAGRIRPELARRDYSQVMSRVTLVTRGAVMLVLEARQVRVRCRSRRASAGTSSMFATKSGVTTSATTSRYASPSSHSTVGGGDPPVARQVRRSVSPSVKGPTTLRATTSCSVYTARRRGGTAGKGKSQGAYSETLSSLTTTIFQGHRDGGFFMSLSSVDTAKKYCQSFIKTIKHLAKLVYI